MEKERPEGRVKRSSFSVRLCLLESLIERTLDEFEREDGACLTDIRLLRTNGVLRIQLEGREADVHDRGG